MTVPIVFDEGFYFSIDPQQKLLGKGHLPSVISPENTADIK